MAPFKVSNTFSYGGITYDTVNKRIYAAMHGLPFGNVAIHCWQITGSSATVV